MINTRLVAHDLDLNFTGRFHFPLQTIGHDWKPEGTNRQFGSKGQRK
jgi:hypothetical protein